MSVSYIPLKSLIGDTSKLRRTFRPSQAQCRLRRSIIKDGLLNPLRVRQFKNKYFVVDGKKRLKILKDLARSKLFARSLYKIPCILDDGKARAMTVASRPFLMSDAELVHAVVIDLRAGQSKADIAQRFDCDVSVIEDAQRIENLHPEVLQSFNNGAISLVQAGALATIPNRDAQWRVLQQIGPFGSHADIVEAIRSGETVLELPDGNTLILPTRTNPPLAKRAYAPNQARRIAA